MRSVEAGTKLTGKAVASLQDALNLAKEHNLEVPPGIQAIATKLSS